MRINVSFADLERPLFMQGSNLGQKLGRGQKYPDVKLQYDTLLLCLIVKFKNCTTLVPSANISSMDMLDKNDIELLPIGSPPRQESFASIDAGQVSGAGGGTMQSGHAQAQIGLAGAQVEVPTQPKIGRKTQ